MIGRKRWEVIWCQACKVAKSRIREPERIARCHFQVATVLRNNVKARPGAVGLWGNLYSEMMLTGGDQAPGPAVPMQRAMIE